MYDVKKIIALFTTVGWLAFIFARFNGFVFWYGGFVVLLWIAISILNYSKNTSFIFVKTKPVKFLGLYLVLVILAFLVDFVLGQKFANLWDYPFYNSIDDWFRLYLILYPFGALAVLELTYYVAEVFGERLIFKSKPISMIHRLVDVIDYVLLVIIFSAPFIKVPWDAVLFRQMILFSFFLWIAVSIIQVKFHLSHWAHSILIFTLTLFLSVFLHELPNVNTFEWRYNEIEILPGFFNQSILGVFVWVIVGWYVIVLITFRLWILLSQGRVFMFKEK